MGIRETIRQRQSAAITIVAIVILLTGYVIYRQFSSGGPSRQLQNSRFYSDDDGQTWFIDAATRIPPFDHNGRPACEAEVFACGTGKMFVAYLQKYSDRKRNEIEASAAQHPEQLEGLLQTPMQIKRPGDRIWLSPDAPGGSPEIKAYNKTLTPVCPEGTRGITHVMPTDQETGATQ